MARNLQNAKLKEKRIKLLKLIEEEREELTSSLKIRNSSNERISKLQDQLAMLGGEKYVGRCFRTNIHPHSRYNNRNYKYIHVASVDMSKGTFTATVIVADGVRSTNALLNRADEMKAAVWFPKFTKRSEVSRLLFNAVLKGTIKRLYQDLKA